MDYQAFKRKVIGSGYDLDRAFGNQCWDGAMKFMQELGTPIFFCTTTGYVRDIWEQRHSNGILKYYDEVDVMQQGDIAVFKISPETPYSHIAIFDHDAGHGRGYFLGQNQGAPNGVFNVVSLPYSATYPTAFRLKKKPAKVGKIGYLAHVQNIGWQQPVYDGEMAGTTGKSLRMEAFKIFSTDGTLVEEIQIYVDKQGWKRFKNPGKDTVLGTTGKSLKMESVTIKTSKPCKFRVHIQDIGWTAWLNCDGKSLGGTAKSGKRLEAIEIKRV